MTENIECVQEFLTNVVDMFNNAYSIIEPFVPEDVGGIFLAVVALAPIIIVLKMT